MKAIYCVLTLWVVVIFLFQKSHGGSFHKVTDRARTTHQVVQAEQDDLPMQKIEINFISSPYRLGMICALSVLVGHLIGEAIRYMWRTYKRNRQLEYL